MLNNKRKRRSRNSHESSFRRISNIYDLHYQRVGVRRLKCYWWINSKQVQDFLGLKWWRK